MESWPVATPEFEIATDEVAKNLESARDLMRTHGLGALAVTSADRHLNEYTPRIDNHRYYLSGFTGSTALMLVPVDGRAKLFVDGRYHIQADQEVDSDLIEVVKVTFGGQLTQALLDSLAGRGTIGCEGDRMSTSLADAVEESADAIHAFDDGELASALARSPLTHAKPLEFIDPAISGRTVSEKLEVVFADIEAPESTVLLLSALDDIAWLSEGRGYHFPCQSSFAATGFATADEVHISVDPEVLAIGCEGAPASVFFHAEPVCELLESSSHDQIEVLRYDPAQVTPSALRKIAARRPDWRRVSGRSPVVGARAVKTPAELEHFESMNRRSSQAITNTIRWVRERIAAGDDVSEAGFYAAANGYYEAQGARDLSFGTIAAVGADTAIIHFSDPKASVFASPDDLMLLDSGGLYEGGFSTDITRSFLAGGARAKASARQKEIYTLVLKGVLRAMHAVFPAGTRGSFLDSLARAPLYERGYDYAHGTGHGVGIHVHEPGVGLGPGSPLVLREGHVTSIEPGIYLEGFGGVRIENVVVCEPHDEFEGFLKTRPLNYVGYDPNLIDRNLLDSTENEDLDLYHSECEKRGTADFEAR